MAKMLSLGLLEPSGCCPHATITLKEGIEKDLREQVDPEILVTRAE